VLSATDVPERQCQTAFERQYSCAIRWHVGLEYRLDELLVLDALRTAGSTICQSIQRSDCRRYSASVPRVRCVVHQGIAGPDVTPFIDLNLMRVGGCGHAAALC